MYIVIMACFSQAPIGSPREPARTRHLSLVAAYARWIHWARPALGYAATEGIEWEDHDTEGGAPSNCNIPRDTEGHPDMRWIDSQCSLQLLARGDAEEHWKDEGVDTNQNRHEQDRSHRRYDPRSQTVPRAGGRGHGPPPDNGSEDESRDEGESRRVEVQYCEPDGNTTGSAVAARPTRDAQGRHRGWAPAPSSRRDTSIIYCSDGIIDNVERAVGYHRHPETSSGAASSRRCSVPSILDPESAVLARCGVRDG